MKTLRRKQSGFTLIFAAIVALGLAILAGHISKSIQVTTGQMLYFNNMNRVYKLAESGLTETLGKLSLNPDPGLINGNSYSVPGEGDYQSYATLVSTPSVGTFYIVTGATRTVKGKTYSCKLHTYASVANLGDYFAAFQNIYIFSPGMDATGGKVYAPNVTFLVSTAPAHPNPTKALEVEYVGAALAQNSWNSGETWLPNVWTTQGPAGVPVVPNEVLIGAGVLPVQLSTLKNFPQVTTGDLTRYLNLATANSGALPPSSCNPGTFGCHKKSNFSSWTHIFPPGYVGGIDPSDPYLVTLGHSTFNEDHVYYSSGSLTIGSSNLTTIHGQILFVSASDILIDGDIVNDTSTMFPGAGFVSSSTAHQAVFITRNNIIVNTPTKAYKGAHSTTTVNAFMFAPNGFLHVAQSTGSVPVRCFNFLGSQVFADASPPPNNLPTGFPGQCRNYAYMTTLKSNPPPYMPALTIIYYSFEDITGSANLY